MHEYRKFRCCMCPNTENPQSDKCPTGPSKPEVTPCRFVKKYTDKRGWKCMKNLDWKKSFDEAQSDLNVMAEKKGWKEIVGTC